MLPEGLLLVLLMAAFNLGKPNQYFSATASIQGSINHLGQVSLNWGQIKIAQRFSLVWGMQGFGRIFNHRACYNLRRPAFAEYERTSWPPIMAFLCKQQ